MALGFSTFTLELTRSLGGLEELGRPTWVPWLAVALGALLLVGRRRWPLSVAVLAAAHMFVVGITMPVVMAQLSMQIIYFAAFFSGVAWARNRREMVVVVGALMAFMFVWLAWHFALGRGVDDIRDQLDADAARSFGAFRPVTAALLLTTVVNVLYFGGAVLAGQLSWRGARQQARLAEQAELLAAQSEELRRRAVVEERLRIARELHDVVAHHVSVIGVQAAAARRVLGRGPEHTEAARTALGEIEQSSREAVTQMRGLLGTLRAHEEPDAAHRPRDPAAPGDGVPVRAPAPGLADLPALVSASCGQGFTATYQMAENPRGATRSVPAPLAHSLYRTAQEALANVRRHSTARRAGVVLRVDRTSTAAFAEVEVTDDGHPRSGTSGSGLGQLGIRERAASHDGVVDIGPRVTGGYRVRVRLPLRPDAPSAGHVTRRATA